MVTNRSLKLFAQYCSNDGKGGILETSNCLFPFKWWNLWQNFNNVKKQPKKKTCLSLKEVLKQRLCSHWLEKLAASTHDLSNTADLQLKLSGTKIRDKHYFLSERPYSVKKKRAFFLPSLYKVFFPIGRTSEILNAQRRYFLVSNLFSSLCVKAEGSTLGQNDTGHFAPQSFPSAWWTQLRTALAVPRQPHARLNWCKLHWFALEWLQEKSPSNLCYYFCVNCLQWNQEFTVYFCALLST